MKRKIFGILFALVLVLSFSLIPAMPVGANPTSFNNSGYTFQMLTNNTSGGAEKVCNPSFSPDGTRVVYMKGIYNGTAQIWVMKSDGTEKQRIDNGNGYEGVPFWSSDGSRIIWEGGADDDRSAMAVDVTITGGNYSYSEPYVFFHKAPEDYATLGIENVHSGGYNCCNPSWFPGNDKIVFWVFFTNNQADLFAYEKSTDALERITNTPNYSDYEPKVSPDGSEIIYWSGETGIEPGPNVHTIPTTGWPKLPVAPVRPEISVSVNELFFEESERMMPNDWLLVAVRFEIVVVSKLFPSDASSNLTPVANAPCISETVVEVKEFPSESSVIKAP